LKKRASNNKTCGSPHDAEFGIRRVLHFANCAEPKVRLLSFFIQPLTNFFNRKKRKITSKSRSSFFALCSLLFILCSLFIALTAADIEKTALQDLSQTFNKSHKQSFNKQSLKILQHRIRQLPQRKRLEKVGKYTPLMDIFHIL